MPIFDDNSMQGHALAGTGYGFSARRIEDLGASEYTLCVIACDTSGSVAAFQGELERAVKEVVKTCRRSPRADNLMLRLVTFDDDVKEQHGFRPLTECDLDKYDGCVRIGGMTALYDAAVNGVRSVVAYGEQLTRQDYGVNAVVFVLTDGGDNKSKLTPDEIRRAVDEAVKGEALESILTVLIGVNVQDAQISQYLKALQRSARFDQYVELKDANEKTLAKLARFVSHSISSQSQALGTGGPSRSVNPAAFSI